MNVKELLDDVNVSDIQTRLAEYDSGYICDAISEIADGEVDIYYSELFKWAADNWSYIDDACREFGMPDARDSNIIIKLIQQAQYYANEEELYEDLDNMLLYFCYSQLYYDFKIETITEEQDEAIQEKCTNVDNNDRLDEFVDFLEELINSEDEDEEA